MLPKKWGQGQLFAFSALDGESFFSDDFSGTLSGDKIGVIFETACRRTLYFGDVHKYSCPGIKCVTSDMIIVESLIGTFSMLFAERHLVVGEYSDVAGVFVSFGGECKVTVKDGVEIHSTDDGEYTALLKSDDRFAFAYGKSENDVMTLCKKGLSYDLEELKEKKAKIYESLCRNDEYSALYAKCISVMKTQLYSPEGNFRRIWSTPDRRPHRNLWLWDSVFHAIGHRHLDVNLAQNLILALFDVQRDDGFIPHMAKPDSVSDITQPPVIAWGALTVYEKSGDKSFLKTVFENNKAFLFWCRDNRRKSEMELYSWHTNPELNNRCDESGMDNSPRFDTESDLYAIDFSCYMANETRCMKKIAEELGDGENAELFGRWYERIRSDINAIHWCDKDGFYYDYDIVNRCFNKVQSVSSFLPLFAGVCDINKSELLIGHLTDSEKFGTQIPIPTISKRDITFGTDMWRGPVWVNYNYMISEGLEEYGYEILSRQIKKKTVDIVNEWYNRTGTVFEFYDSENVIPPFCFNRKGEVYEPYDFRIKYQAIRDYGWSVTLVFDLLNEI